MLHNTMWALFLAMFEGIDERIKGVKREGRGSVFVYSTCHATNVFDLFESQSPIRRDALLMIFSRSGFKGT